MPNTSSLPALEAQLSAARDGAGTLALTASMLPAGDLASFVAALPGGLLALDGVALSPLAPSFPLALTLTARARSPLAVPGLSVMAVSGAEVVVTFAQSAGAASVTAALSVPEAALSSAHGAMAVAGELGPGGTLTLRTAPSDAAPPRVDLADLVGVLTGSRVQRPVLKLIPAFASLPVSRAEVALTYGAAAGTSASLTAGVPGQIGLVDGLLALGGAEVSIAATLGDLKDPDAPPTSFALDITAAMTLGAFAFDVAVRASGAQSVELSALARDGQPAPDLPGLAGLLGGEALRAAAQSGLKAVGLEDVGVDGLTLSVDAAARRLSGASIAGRATLAGGRLKLGVDLLPALAFSAALVDGSKGGDAPPSGIRLDALAAAALGEGAGLPPITVTALALDAAPGARTFAVSADCTEDWRWALGAAEGGPTLTLGDVSFAVARSEAGTTGSLGVTLTLGAFALSLSADYRGPGQGWLLSGTAVEAEGADAGAFLADVGAKLGVAVPPALAEAASALRLDVLRVTVDTLTKDFTFEAEVVGQVALPLGLADAALDVALKLSSALDPATGRRALAGHLAAELAMGAAAFALTADFGPARTVAGRWTSTGGETLGLADILRAVGLAGGVDLPAGLDLGLTSAAFEARSDSRSFALSAASARFGGAFFALARAADDSTGFVFSVDAPRVGRLSDLPGIGGQLRGADFLSVEGAAVLVSSAAFPNFVPPVLPSPPSAAGGAPGAVAGGSALQLGRGVSLVAAVDLSAAGDGRLANLRAIVGRPKLLVQASFGPSSLSLFAWLPGTVSIPAGGASRLVLGGPVLRIDTVPALDVQLSGSLGFTVLGTPVTATARLAIGETGAQVAVSVAADQKPLPAPPGVKGLHLRQFGIEMGVFFEPPGVDLGLQGKLRIGPDEGAPDDAFAIVLQMVGEVPNLLYLAFRVDKLDLGQAVVLFTDVSDSALVGQLSVVKASDLSFHWSETVVVLPDGSQALPGFGFSGTVQVLDAFSGHADFEIGALSGIRGHAEISPIDLRGVLVVGGGGKGITRARQQVGGAWTEVSNTAVVRTLPAPSTRREAVIPPGGPVIAFDSKSSPYLVMSIDVTLFDAVHARVEALVENGAFAFVLRYDLAGLSAFDMHCALKGPGQFSAAASLRMHLDAAVGPIRVAGVAVGSLHLAVDLDAALSIALDPQRFQLDLRGEFAFDGARLSMPTVSLTAAPASLKELPGQAVQGIRAEADRIFAPLLGDAGRWADMVRRGVLTGIGDAAGVLKAAYGRTAADAAKLMAAAHRGADEIASGLRTAYGCTAEVAASALRGAGFAADAAAAALRSAFGAASPAAAAALRAAGYAAGEVGGALKTAFGAADREVAGALRGAGWAAEEVGGALRSAFGVPDGAAAAALRAAGFGAGEVGKALRAAYGDADRQVAGALRAVGFPAGDVAGALRSAFGDSADAAASALRGAGFGADEIGNALRSAYGATADGVARALHAAGFAVNETGAFVKNAFGLGADQLKSTLQGVGYAGDQVKGFFRGLGGSFAHVFEDPVKKLDPRRW